MNCKQCGNPIIPGSRNCNVCGAEVEQTAAINNQGINQNVGMQTFGVEQNNPSVNATTVSSGGVENNLVGSNVNQSTPINSTPTTIPSNNPFLTNQVASSPVQNSFVTPSVSVDSVASSNNSVAVNNTTPAPSFESTVPTNSSETIFDNNIGGDNLNNNQSLNQNVSSQPMGVPSTQVPNISQVNNDLGQGNDTQVVPEVNQKQTPSASVPIADNAPIVQAPLEEVTEKPKKKVKLGLIIIIVLVIAVIAYFVFQYVSLTNEANKVKNNNTNNIQLKNKSDKIISEDAYETIAHQDDNYVEYNFDFNSINDIYENEYTIGNHKVKMSITSDKTGIISIKDNKQEISYPVVKIYHLLKSDILFIENQLFTNDSELYIYSGNSIDNVKTNLVASQFIENISIKDNILEFTSGSWKESNVFSGSDSFNVCQEGYINRLAEDYAVETTYTFDIQETTYSNDKLKSTTKKTVKQFYDEKCSVATTPNVPTTEQSTTSEGTNQVKSTVDQTPKIETIAPVGQ